MPNRYISVRDELRDLERRLLDVCGRVDSLVERQPLYRVASTIGTFAEMLPAYTSLLDLLEKVYPVANEPAAVDVVTDHG